ncbi:flagellar protein FlgN [Candidatus Gottesmanbacteria bacterium]|nr:flagellar protein FlgN [Candidatus Gottesmanbacteria bacterium]
MQILSTSLNIDEDIWQKDETLKNLLNELSGVLEVEIDQYQECLDLLHKQQEKIVAGDSSGVEKIGKKQDTLILKIKTLEEGRKSIVLQLAQYFDTSAREFNLTKLTRLVRNPYSERFIAYQKQILYLIKKLECLRESNTYLLQNALHYINGILKIFASFDTIETAYSKEGLLEFNLERVRRISEWG